MPNKYYIKEVIIPNSVSTISAYNFINCSNLEKISLTERKDDYYSVDGIVYNGNSVVFYPSGKKNESYELPDNITQLSDSSFSYNYYLKNITLPEELTTIGMYAFNQCYKLEEINIPKSVKFIGRYAFSKSALQNAYFEDYTGWTTTTPDVYFAGSASLKLVAINGFNIEYKYGYNNYQYTYSLNSSSAANALVKMITIASAPNSSAFIYVEFYEQDWSHS